MDELKERLKKILESEYGIRTEAELQKALKDMTGTDIGIFTGRQEAVWTG